MHAQRRLPVEVAAVYTDPAVLLKQHLVDGIGPGISVSGPFFAFLGGFYVILLNFLQNFCLKFRHFLQKIYNFAEDLFGTVFIQPRYSASQIAPPPVPYPSSYHTLAPESRKYPYCYNRGVR